MNFEERQEVENALVVSLRKQLDALNSDVEIKTIDDVKKHVKKPNWKQVLAGKLSRRSAYESAFAVLGITDDAYITDFIERYDHAGKYVLPAMWELLEDLAKDPRVESVILSNHAKELMGVLHEFEIVPKYVKEEMVFISAATGFRKPSPDAYKNCSKKIQAAPSDMLFIDDKPANVQSAKDCGLHSILYSFDPKACGPKGEGDTTCKELREQIMAWIDTGQLKT